MGERHRSRRFGLAAVVVALGAVAVGVVGLAFSGGGEPDPLSEFCSDAKDEVADLAGSDAARADALARLGDAAPEELAELVEAASGSDAGPGVDDMFVVPGDRTSDVKADVAAEVFGRMAESGQAWDRVEQVLVGECELDLGEGAVG